MLKSTILKIENIFFSKIMLITAVTDFKLINFDFFFILGCDNFGIFH